MTGPHDDIPLSTLVERGGVFYKLPGTTVESCIAELIRRTPCLNDAESGASGGFNAEFLRAVLEREALMPTGIGRGIALPHPRNPLITEAGRQCVSIGFPAVPVDWKALDGKPIHTALLIASASAKFHLRALLKINFLCREEGFLSLLQEQAPRDRIIGAIRDIERGWK
ncbi:MAG: PTS sugar transporter subunit IIA [Treponema sp.]|jgi:PTS system nitrogen regulatory IIA component|nr:PTS sugar transporter subunit IIA [Treponema sp.]